MSAGYSGTPLAKKLGVKDGGVLLTVSAPRDFEVELPDGASLRPLGNETAAEPHQVTLAFFSAHSEMAGALAGLGGRVFPAGSLWVAWPRRAGGHESDIAEQDIRDLALPLGLVDNKVAAIDNDWSGLRLVWRRELRGLPAPPAP